MSKLKRFKAFALCVIAGAIVTSMVIPIEAATKTGKVTADVLNLRASKSLVSSVIEKIPNDATVSILDSSDAKWLKVSYNNKTGYVSKEFVKDTNGQGISLGSVDATTLNVRKTANLNAEIVAKLDNGQTVTIESKSGNWYSIAAGSIKGYVSSEFIKSQTLTGKVNADTLNIRAGKSTTAQKVGSAMKNAQVEISGIYGDWYYIKVGSVKGYVFSEFITPNKAVTTANAQSSPTSSASTTGQLVKGNIFKCTANILNVRKGAGTSYASVATISMGNQVTFQSVSKDNNWYQVTTSKGVTGYVDKNYVAFYSAPKSTTRQTASDNKNSTTSQSNEGATLADKIVAKAKTYLGVPYVYGGASPSGFDCSGFTQYVFKQFGISLSRSALAQSTNGTYVAKSDLRPGDLVFFGSYIGQTQVGHAGLYIGNGQFIQACSGSRSMKVVITNLSDPFYVKVYKFGKRVIK